MCNIIICGPNGCGKTTLGKTLAKKLDYIHKDIESYYFVASPNGGSTDYKYDKPRSKAEVVQALEKDFYRAKNDRSSPNSNSKGQQNNNLILTACKGDYGNIEDFIDIAIYINIDKDARLKRVRQRSINQFGDRAQEGGDLYEKELQFFNMVKNRNEAEFRAWFDELDCKTKIELDGNKTVEDNVLQVIRVLKEMNEHAQFNSSKTIKSNNIERSDSQR